jgi:hypothetical protein
MDNNINSETTTPKVFERDSNKKYSMKKSISQVNYNRSKTKNQLFEESFSKDIIQTNLERMISNLNVIKKRLLLIQDMEMAREIDWMVDTLLRNQLNDVIVRVEKDNTTNTAELEKMLELLAEFSSELSFKRNLEQLQSTLFHKKSSIMVTNSNNDNLGDIFNLQDLILTKNFDIFQFTENVGRDNSLLVIGGNLFNYFSLFDKIDKDIFKSFIEEIRLGYKKANPYHNVNCI